MNKTYDHLLQEINVGDRVRCESPIEGYLTNEKVYTVMGLQPDDKRVVIIDDLDREGWYKADRFIVQQHFSELP